MLYWFMLLIEIFSCTIELTTGRKSHKLIFENLHKWTSSKQQKKISTWSCAVCAVGAAKRRSRISRVSIVSWGEEEPEEEEREKEEKYWPWRHILKQLNRNYSHLLFRSFRSFFSPLIPVCVSQQKKKNLRRERNSGSKSTPLLLTLFPVCFLVDRFSGGRDEPRPKQSQSAETRAMKEEKVKLKLISTSIALSTQASTLFGESRIRCLLLFCAAHTIFRDKSSCPGRCEIVLNFIVVVVDVSLGHRKI